MKKVLFILESRASFGYSKNLISIFNKNKRYKYKNFVTGTHLSKELGNSVTDIKKERIKLDFISKFNHLDLSKGIADTIKNTNNILKKFDPDFVIIFGDRVELLGVAISCIFNDKIICHVQAGDKSGHIDDLTRMTLAKLCHVHFPATDQAKKRLIKLGEEKFRIHKVGAPQLDDIKIKEIRKNPYIYYEKKKINLLKEKYFVILQHSVFKDKMSYGKFFENTIKASLKFNYKVFFIYPNYDQGYKFIIKIIQKYKNKLTIIKHLRRKDFLKLIYFSQTLLGNSSAGILETPSLNVPTVNIGDRQDQREQNQNIFNCSYKLSDIKKTINISLKYYDKKKIIKNIHGDGKSSLRIIKILDSISNSNVKKFLNKKTTY
jgi:UDP-N-acetylglucosamine 2-epimerase (non-hydrolysing)/GDP/UDP-N,N'-diacetylbacillosamine 2-epimerase (hydrolysing)